MSHYFSPGLAIVISLLRTSQSAHHDYHFLSKNNEILTAFTWATIGGPQDYWISPAEDLNKTYVTYSNVMPKSYVTSGNITSTSIRSPNRPRKTRSLPAIFNDDISTDITLKTVIPIFQVHQSTFLRLELPLTYKIPLKSFSHKIESTKRASDEAASTSGIEDIEGFVSLLGVDGKACVRRCVCEMAAAPSLNLRGFVGEVVQIFVRLPPSNGEYMKAAEYGKEHGDCWRVYPECPISILSLVNS
ncbi:uncharacterized protein LOC135200494 [Macrobrachium nipponense]|uniref:uncharacterized protein LOC135200494 n=1 Tax=Macrobrachium nipponense TaxID=159736 RepID=UPI0030C7A4B9